MFSIICKVLSRLSFCIIRLKLGLCALSNSKRQSRQNSSNHRKPYKQKIIIVKHLEKQNKTKQNKTKQYEQVFIEISETSFPLIFFA